MKILMVLSYYFPYISRLSEYCRRISEELAKKGNRVTVVTSQHDKKLPEKEKVNGVEVVRCPYFLKVSKGLVMPSFIFTAANEAKKHDVVNIHLPMLEAGLLQQLIGKKAVITYHCDLRLGNTMGDKMVEKLYYISAAAAVKKAKKIITYTEDYAMTSRLLRHYIGKCSYINPIVDKEHFKHVAGAAAKFKKLNGLENKRVVGFAGRFVYEKGLSYLLKAIPAILRRIPDAAFVFAGEYANVAGRSIISELEGLINAHRENIILLGNVPYEKLPEFYSACNVLVLPSIDPLEAFGIVQVEAMLCGTPVVATDLPGVRVPVTKTGMGLIIPPMDEKGLAAAVVKIMKETRKYVKNRKDILRSFGAKAAVERYAGVLNGN